MLLALYFLQMFLDFGNKRAEVLQDNQGPCANLFAGEASRGMGFSPLWAPAVYGIFPLDSSFVLIPGSRLYNLKHVSEVQNHNPSNAQNQDTHISHLHPWGSIYILYPRLPESSLAPRTKSKGLPWIGLSLVLLRVFKSLSDLLIFF